MVTGDDGGFVLVIEGEHKGKIGYFDDDEVDCKCFDDDEDGSKYTEEETLDMCENCTCPTLAVVYFGAPFTSEPYLIPYSHLELTDIHHFETIKMIKENPKLAEDMRMCVKDIDKYTKKKKE